LGSFLVSVDRVIIEQDFVGVNGVCVQKWPFASVTIHDTVGAPLAAPEICDILGRSKRRPYDI